MGEPLDLLARIEALELELARLKGCDSERLHRTGDVAAPPADSRTGTEPAASRRDLLRYGAVALGAAAAAGGIGGTRVDAADGGPVIIGASNNGTGITQLSATGTYAFFATTTQMNYSGVGGAGPEFGTYGYNGNTAAEGAGVFGFAPSGTGTSDGVRGVALSPSGVGVRGICSAGGNAVRAEVPATASQNAIALYALNYSSYAGPSLGAGGFAIYGLSAITSFSPATMAGST